MKILVTRIGQAVAATLLAAGGLTIAQAQTLPPAHHAGKITYVTGGVSDDAASAFKQARGHYPLSIELVEKSAGAKAEYTADARVKVLDASGATVLDAHADGPFMLVRLPAGRYRVQASLNGHTVESAPLTVAAKGSTHALLEFPAGAG